MRLPILLALALTLSVGLADATERSASAKSEFKAVLDGIEYKTDDLWSHSIGLCASPPCPD